MIDLLGRKLRRKEAELKERELELAEKQADIDDRKLKQQQVIARMMQEEQVNRARKDAPIAITPPYSSHVRSAGRQRVGRSNG